MILVKCLYAVNYPCKAKKCSNCFLLDDCRNIEFREKKENTVLISHVIKSKWVLKEENCQIYCYLEANCVSYNYGPAEDELYLCELSDKNHLQVPSDELEERHGFLYRPVAPVSKLKQRCPRSIYHKRVLHVYYLLSIVNSNSNNFRSNSNQDLFKVMSLEARESGS